MQILCYKCGLPLGKTRGRVRCHVCHQDYCNNCSNFWTKKCDTCDLDPTWGLAHRPVADAAAAKEFNGCGTAILVLIWAFFAAFFGFLVYTSPHVSAETVRNAGDPLTNGFFLADASVVALGLVSMAIAVIVKGKGLGRVVGLTVFLALLVTELVFIFRFHQLYLRS
jgi:hypothetical protein